MTSSSFHHVTNGGATTARLDAAAVPGGRSLWCDVLYEGPVPGQLDDEELLEIRARFLADTVPDRTAEIAADLRAWRRAILDAVSARSELVLWFEHDLFDQLNLIQLLSWIRNSAPDGRVSLVSIDRFPGRPNFMGLGQLTPAEIAPLLATRLPVTAPQYDLAERAWAAFRDPSPTVLDDLRRQDLSALPFLRNALTRYLQEFPWTRDGLSRSERRLLEIAREGHIDVTRAFPRMHEGETSYYITDGSLATLITTLSRSSSPLLVRRAYEPDGNLLNGTITLTNAGRDVLDGRIDRIDLCGIDRWLGGVHLELDDVWRWDEAVGMMTHA